MKVLVVGGGGREHAVVRALSRSQRVTELYCAPGNGGIAGEAVCVGIAATDVAAMVDFAKREGMELVVVTPDDPLALGMVNAMEAAGLRTFGPYAEAAIIESSKVFSKELMQKYGIPTAEYAVFDDLTQARSYLRERGVPIVVKADGLALGKGVVVADDITEADDFLVALMRERKFGESGAKVVIEEVMTGPEVTVLCFTDGETMLPMLSSQDHKRAFDGNRGPNTGGMGAFCPSPLYTPDIAERCMETIYLPTMRALNAENRRFKGVLYFGLMLTPEGPKVVEYNARFGDPEAQPILAMLKTDIADIFEAIIDERLSEIELEFESGSACCVVMSSGGYPTAYETGFEIDGLESMPDNVFVYHAGSRLEDGKYYTNGGRVLGVTAWSDTLAGAVEEAYAAVRRIRFEEMHYRTDIGKQ